MTVKPIPPHELRRKIDDGYHALLLGYASGTLDEAQNLIVAAHLALSPSARAIVKEYECLGASFLEHDCEPESLCDEALANVLAQLELSPSRNKAEKTGSCPQECFSNPKLCAIDLIHYVMGKSTPKNKNWKKVYPGFKSYELALDCKASKARIMHIDPSRKSPFHTHGGLEITLVLQGSYIDETGQYKRGDLVVTDESFHHAPISCPDQGCICMIVSATPIRLSGIAKLLNPFIRI